MIKPRNEIIHLTPFDTIQNFLFCSFKKVITNCAFGAKEIVILKMIIQIELELKIYNKFTVWKLKQFSRFNKLFFLEDFKPYEKNFNRFI